jgi:transposase
MLSLRDRIYRSSTLSPSSPVSSTSISTRYPIYKRYNEDQLIRAYEAVNDGASIRAAAEQYGVPRSTLSDYVSGKIPFGKRSGPERYLSDEEEKELVHFICQSAKMGYAKTRKEILSIVEKVLSLKWKNL